MSPETYYKAVRPDGTDFWSGTVRWLPRTPLKRARTRPWRTVIGPIHPDDPAVTA